MKNKMMLLFVAVSGSLLCGCIASERDMSTLKLQLQELNSTIVQMQANQAELAGKMDELNHNLSVSNENLSQVDNQFSQLSAKLDDLSAQVRGGTAPATPATPVTAPEAAQPEQSVQPAQPAPAVLPSDLFAEAKELLDKGAFDQAATGFKLYITKYPQGENVEQAYMYMGDAYAEQRQNKSAAIAYATILKNFPKSKLTASARLKYARNIIPLGKTDEAKKYFNSIVKDFPASSEAKLAKSELAKLK